MSNEERRSAAPTRRRFWQGTLALAAACKSVAAPQPAQAEAALRTLAPMAEFGEGIRGSLLLALSPDGKTILTSLSMTNEAILWDVKTREQVKTFRSDEVVVATDFLADGKRAIIAGSNKVQLWDVAGARVISTIATQGDKIETAALAPDDRHLAISQEGQLSLWDLRTGARITVRNDPDLGLLRRLAFAPNGKWLACVYRDQVRACEPASLQPVAQWPVESASGGLACSLDSRLILFGDGERVRILDVAGKREVGRVDQPGAERSFFLGMAALHKDLFATGDSNGHLLIGSTTQPRFIARSADPPIKANRVAISRDQKFAYVGTEAGQVLVFDVSGLA